MVNTQKKQLKSDVTKLHQFHESLHEDYFVPPHPPRTESRGFAALKRKWRKEGKMICEVCGTTENIELHHRIVEWAWHTVADQEKVAKEWPQVKGMSRQEFLDWLDHGEEAIVPLCALHHRHREVGIHETAAPSFNLVKYLEDDFTLVDG